jgi:2-keto-4-pentenoate hydratase
MTTEGIDQVAQAILTARRECRPVDALSCAGKLRNANDAYAVQDAVAHALEPAGEFPRHWKSGGPGREQPLTHAALPAAGVWPGPAVARNWPFNVRLIEAEIALRLGRAVEPSLAAALTTDSARSLVDAMAVSIEIVDSRWRQAMEAPALLKLADLQSHGALVLGEWRDFAPPDWAMQECDVEIGSAPPVRRRGTHSLGDPAWVLAQWLRHATRNGQAVPAGTVVTTGTWCGVLQASAGDLVTVRFAGVGDASVQL